MGISAKMSPAPRPVGHELELSFETISSDVVNELLDKNRNTVYEGRVILEAVTQGYRINGKEVVEDPVGIACDSIEAHLLNITWRRSFNDLVQQAFNNAGLQIADTFISPIAQAESICAETERRNGCVIVDLGAETTTVCVYNKNKLRHLVVLPLGMNNITKDIMAVFEVDEIEAEQLKLKYGSAYTDPQDLDNSLKYDLSDGRSIESAKLLDVIEGRVLEIVDNVWNQVPEEYAAMRGLTIVATGGGSGIKNLDKAFREVTKAEKKLRIATSIKQDVDATDEAVRANDSRLNVALSILCKGDQNCMGESLAEDNNRRAEAAARAAEEARKQAEEEARKQAEEERQKREEEERQREEEEERQRRENSWGRKLTKWFKGMVNSALEED